MRAPIRLAVGASLAVLALIGLGACTSDGADPAPTSSSSADAAETWTSTDLAAALFAAPATSGSLATVTGAVPSTATPNPATVEVTEVRANSTSTLVRFTLRNVDEPGTFDIRGITLIDTAATLRLQPYIGRLANELTMGNPLCACSDAPLQMSKQGQLLSAVFPPLAASSTTVTLELLGFPLLENLTVTRD